MDTDTLQTARRELQVEFIVQSLFDDEETVDFDSFWYEDKFFGL